MGVNDIKIAYNAAQRRVRVEFIASECHRLPEPPQGCIEKAKARMEVELALGNINHYLLYEARFRQLWRTIREEIPIAQASTEKINVTLALGGPKIKGCQVTPPTEAGAAFNLSFNAQIAEMSNWNFEWLKLFIAVERRKQNLDGPGNPAQINAAWIRALDGVTVNFLAINPVPEFASGGGKPFKVVGNRQRQEASIVVYDHRMLTDKAGLERLLKAGADAARRMGEGENEPSYVFRKAEMTTSLKNAINGSERFGVDMPLVLLVATGEKTVPKIEAIEASLASVSSGGGIAKSEVSQEGRAPKQESPGKPKQIAPPKNYPGVGLLDITVDEDNMEALIGEWNSTMYSIPSFTPDKSWVTLEAERQGIIHGISRANMVRILDGLARKKNLSGYLLAQGTRGTVGKKPYLHPVYLDRQQAIRAKKAQVEVINIRESQTAESVIDGDLVAEIRYRIAPVMGKDIYGNSLNPPEPESFDVKIGEGITRRSDGRFYAAMDGMPRIEDNMISISSKYIHEGDVNLKTGNVYFDGPAEIRGAIDSGATVIVTGDLVIKGPVLNAFVRAGGNINAMMGICTTEKGRIQAGCDIIADFAENSNITCGGNLIVRKGVMNCNVIVGGYIELDKATGVLAGGTISCKQYISTGKLGFPKGNKTFVNVGVDWRVELAVRIRQGRITKIERINNEDRMAMRELIRKKREQLTARHQELIDKLQLRLQRQREILDKLGEHLKAAQSMLVWDDEARIYCHETMSNNVELKVGGNPVPIPNEIAGILVSTKRRRGSYVISLADAKKDDRD